MPKEHMRMRSNPIEREDRISGNARALVETLSREKIEEWITKYEAELAETDMTNGERRSFLIEEIDTYKRALKLKAEQT